MHEYIPVIILVVGLFAGIWINRCDFSDLKSDMNRRLDYVESEFGRRLDRIESEFGRRLDRIESELGRRLDHIEARLERVDADLRDFYGTDKQLEGRVNELSARIK